MLNSLGCFLRSLTTSTLGKSVTIETFFFCCGSPLTLPALLRIESRRTNDGELAREEAKEDAVEGFMVLLPACW